MISQRLSQSELRSTSLRKDNSVRFDRQTSRGHFERDFATKANGGRFLYLPESELTRLDRKQYYVEFGKK